MARSSKIWRRVVSIFLSAQIVSVCPLASLAATSAPANLSYADLQQLGKSERILFGSERKNLPGEERVKAAEVELFGGAQQGSYHKRVEAIQAAVASGKTDFLMPPLAGELDNRATTGITAAAQPAPPYSSSSKDYEDEAIPTASHSDKTKNLLRQALKLYSAGQYPEAERAFRKVLAIDKSNVDAYYNLGAMAESQGDLRSALANYESALKINPDDNDLKSAAASVRSKLQDANFKPVASDQMPATAPSYQQARKVDGDLKQRINEASTAYKSGNYDRAIKLLKSAAGDAPDQPDIQYALAQCYKGKRQYMEARSALHVAISMDQNNQLYKDALNDLDRQMANGIGGGGNDNNRPGYDTIASDSGVAAGSNAPVGQITPFSGVDSNSNSNSRTGWESTGRSGSYSAGGGYVPGFAYRSSYGGGSATARRIRRAAIGGASGAALGAMFGGGYRSRGRNAMIGGGIGALFGLVSGW